MDVLECLKEKLQEKQLQAIIDNSQKKYQKINDQLNFVQQKLTQLNQDEETYQERYRRLDESLRENETYNLKNELQKESEQLKKEKEKKENSYQTLITEIKQEIQLLKKVPNSYIQILQNQDYQTETLTHAFRNIVEEVSKRTKDVTEKISHLKIEMTQTVDRFNEYCKEYDFLKAIGIKNKAQFWRQNNELIEKHEASNISIIK